MSNDPAMANKPALSPLFTFAPSLPITIDAFDIFSHAIDKATITPARAAIAPTEFHNFAGWMLDNKKIEAANTAIALAMLYIPFVLFSNAAALKFLPNPTNISPIPENMSLRPVRGAANISRTSAIFLTATIIPTLIAIANKVPKSILFIMSTTFLAKFLMPVTIADKPLSIPLFCKASIDELPISLIVDITFCAPDIIPFISPSIIFTPISKNSVDGE